jgi:hypothetical protein
MGRSASDSVLDGQFRVHDTTNLRVVDASVDEMMEIYPLLDDMLWFSDSELGKGSCRVNWPLLRVIKKLKDHNRYEAASVVQRLPPVLAHFSSIDADCFSHINAEKCGLLFDLDGPLLSVILESRWKDNVGQTLLHNLFSQNYTEFLSQAFSKHPLSLAQNTPSRLASDPPDEDDRLGSTTALHNSIPGEDVRETLSLLKSGVDVQRPDEEGRLALHLMTSSLLSRLLRHSSSPEPLRVLLQSDIDMTARLVSQIVKAKNVDGLLTLLHHADIFPHPRATKNKA